MPDAWPNDLAAYPQYFLTHIIGKDEEPNFEILTLPGKADVSDADAARLAHSLVVSTPGGWEFGSELVEPIYPAYPVRSFDGIVRRFVSEAAANPEKRRMGSSYSFDSLSEYVERIYRNQPIPVMNSPISGHTLGSLVDSAGGASAFIGVLDHPTIGHITLYFVVIAGTRIVFGAADGVSIALRHGLAHILLGWMGLPDSVATKALHARPKRGEDIA